LTTSPDAHITRYTTDKDSEVHRALRGVNNILTREFEPRQSDE